MNTISAEIHVRGVKRIRSMPFDWFEVEFDQGTRVIRKLMRLNPDSPFWELFRQRFAEALSKAVTNPREWVNVQ